MDLRLVRREWRDDGIFGELTDEKNNLIAVTLEHAYLQEDGSYKPKIPSGIYQCVLGRHQLVHMTEPFDTFEITDVPLHNNILFHPGNYNDDSEGCVLLGKAYGMKLNGGKMIVNSRNAFDHFMYLQEGVDSFVLIVD